MMKSHVAGLLTLTSLSWTPSVSADEPAPAETPTSSEEPTALNTLYLEGLGPAGLYSLNYERRIADFNIRGGLSYFGNTYYSMVAMPFGFNYIGLGGENAHLELGAVTTVVVIDGDALLGDAAGVVASGVFGFRYQPPDGGFNFRVGASPILGAFGALPWGYISFGATFGGGASNRASTARQSGSEPAREGEPTYIYDETSEVSGEIARADAPTGMGGFEFSMSADEAKAACQASGHSWKESRKYASCSGLPRPIGIAGEIKLQRCGAGFCQMLLTAPVDEHRIIDQVGELKGALEQQYGEVSLQKTAVPQSCHSNLPSCLKEQHAHLEYLWRFRTGEAIKLRLGKRRLPGRPVTGADLNVRLLYTRNPPPKVSLDPSVKPTGFAGFEFSMNSESARRACESAGHTWSESERFGACEGSARDLGVDGNVQMLRCGDNYCQMLFTTEPEESQLVTDVAALKSALERTYGAPTTSNSAIPQDCSSSLVHCIEDHRAYLEYIWEFSGGETVKLRLGKKAHDGESEETADHKIRLLFTRRVPSELQTKDTVDPSAL